jgi:hypothetical protein
MSMTDPKAQQEAPSVTHRYDQPFELIIQAICTTRQVQATLKEQDLWEIWRFCRGDFERFLLLLKFLAKHGTGFGG